MNGCGGLKGAPRLPDGSLMQSLLPACVPGGHSGRSSGAARGLEKGVGFWQVNRRTHEVLLGVPKQNACAGNLPFPGQLGEESIRSLRLAMEELRKIPEACRGALAKLQEAVKALRDALGDEEKTQEALKQCVSAAEELAEVILGRAGAAADYLLESLRALAQGGDEASGILS